MESHRRYAINTVITNEAEPANHLFPLLDRCRPRLYLDAPQGEKRSPLWAEFGAGKVVGWAASGAKS